MSCEQAWETPAPLPRSWLHLVVCTQLHHLRGTSEGEAVTASLLGPRSARCAAPLFGIRIGAAALPGSQRTTEGPEAPPTANGVPGLLASVGVR